MLFLYVKSKNYTDTKYALLLARNYIKSSLSKSTPPSGEPEGAKHQGYNAENYVFISFGGGPVQLIPTNPHALETYKYKFQGQERQDELGLNWVSFKWRNYDHAIGRFMVIDPLASEYAYNSSYAFQENKIGMGRELEGLEMVPERSVDGKNATITYQVKPINNSRLTSEQFKTVIEARKALTESGLTGNTDDGTYLTTNVVFSDDATITWEYNEIITIKPFGAALGATKNVGDTQNNETQVNIYAHIGKDGKLGELTLDSLSEITKTGSHEDQHPGGVPDIGDGTNPELETKMSRDPKGNIMDYSNDGTNVLPEQRSLILRTAEEQYNKRD